MHSLVRTDTFDAVPAVHASPPSFDARTRALLDAPILPIILRLAWPNVFVMLAQSATGLIETWFVGRLGTDALAGMALVFPCVMLMQMLSAGAIGGGISSAVARALGGGRRGDADALVLHALVINGALALLFSVSMLAFGRHVYAALGGRGAALEAALTYSNVVFTGNVFLWTMNGFASVIRGAGNMVVPSAVIFGGVFVLVPLSPCLIFGLGPFPALGVAGGGVAIVLYNVIGTAILGWYVCAGRNPARFRWTRLRSDLLYDILRVGGVGIVSTVQTNLVIALCTKFVGGFGSKALAGFGIASRLEYLLVPLVFGIGAPLVALVGANIGAGQKERALRIGWTGAALAFIVCEVVGVAAAVFPQGWVRIFDPDPTVLHTGALYLAVVGPAFGFFGGGLALYFASQGAGRLLWPLFAGFLRLVTAVGGGWIVLQLTGSLTGLFAAMAAGLVIYGGLVAVSIARGTWFSPPRSRA